MTINQAVGQVDPTGTSPITFTVVFNEAVTGFATGDVTIGGTSGGTKTGTVSGGPTTYSVAVTGMTTSGTVVATIAAGVATDAAGNANAASTSTDNSVTWDSVAPTVTIDLNAASDSGVSNTDNITNAANLVYTLTFSESVTGVTAADLTTTGSTATGCVIGNPTGSGATRSVTLTGCSNGSVVLNFLANGASDLAGNAGPASDVSLTVTVDRIAPTVTVNQAVGQVDPTNVTPIAFTVVFSETVAGFITGDVTVGGTSGGTKTGTVTGGPTTFDVAVTGMTTSGTVVATIAASRATDIAGNNNTASTSTDNTRHLGPGDARRIRPAADRHRLRLDDHAGRHRRHPRRKRPGRHGELSVRHADARSVRSDARRDADRRRRQRRRYVQRPDRGCGRDLHARCDQLRADRRDECRVRHHPGSADHHRRRPDQDLRPDGRVRRHRVHRSSGCSMPTRWTPSTLTSPGAAATATVAGSPYPITASAAVGSGLGNYTISYVPGSLTVTPAALTITADDRTKTYGQTVIFAGTEFTVVRACSMPTPWTRSRWPARARPRPPRWPAARTRSRPPRRSAAASATTPSATSRELTVTPAALTITADDRTKTYGQTVVFAGTEFSVVGLLNGDTVDSVTLASPGAAATATVAGSPYPITASAAVGSGPRQLHHQLRPGEPHGRSGRPDDRGDRLLGRPTTRSRTRPPARRRAPSARTCRPTSTCRRRPIRSPARYLDPWTFTDSTGNYLDDAGTVANEISPRR